MARGEHGLPVSPRGGVISEGLLRWSVLPITAMAGLGVWSVIAADYEARGLGFVFPAPLDVAASAWRNTGRLAEHSGATLTTISLGFLIGFWAAAALGLVISRSQSVERALMPYLIASQAVPVIAVAPILILLLPSDLSIKVTVTAVTVFFPMLINTVLGLRGIALEHLDLMRLMSASRWQQLRYLELPAALPTFLAGLRVGITLSVIGAVVGEFVTRDRGLGYLIEQSRRLYHTELAFAALLVLVTLALGLYGSASLLERLLMARR